MPHGFLERTIPLSLATLMVLSGRSTYAQSTVWLEWNAPLAECGDGAAVEVEVNRLLGGRPVAPEKRVQARVRIERAADGAWHVDLVTERGGTRGERTLSAASCRAAADATALILALIIDPTQVAATRTSDMSVVPAREAPATVAQTSAVEVTPAPSPPPVAADRTSRPQAPPSKKDDTTVLAAGVLGVGDIGALPATAAGIGLLVAWTPGRTRIEASGVDYPDATAHLNGAGGGGSFHLATGSLRGCYAVSVRSPFEGSPCVGFEAGAMGGDGFGVATPGSGTTFWAASVVGGLFAYRLTPHVALRLDTGLSVAFVRPRFVLDNAGFVHRPSALGGRMAFGMEVRF